MGDADYTVRARDLLAMDEVGLLDLEHGERQIARVSGMGEGDVWLQYEDDTEPRAVSAWHELRVRPV